VFRSTVGLLAAIGSATALAAALARGNLLWAVVGAGAAATGLAAHLAMPSANKNRRCDVEDLREATKQVRAAG